MGPYDVVNLDLCDGFGKDAHDKFEENHYNALSQLMTLHHAERNHGSYF